MNVVHRLRSLGRKMLGVADPAPQPPEVVLPKERARVGRWDSKDVDRMNQAHKAKVTGLPINAELAYAIGELRADCEYEISCNPMVEGMLNTYCTDVVGPKGPTYRVKSSDPKYNKIRERVWKKWWKKAGANRQLAGVDIMIGWVKSLFKAGEFGTQLITVKSAEGPVKLRLLPVHMHRLLTPPEMIGDPEVALGVRRDENRNPTKYYISEPYIFGPFEVYTGEFDEVPYNDFIHGFRMDEEDQVRGVPWLASALGTVEQLRDWDKAMLDAAEMLAKTGIVWQLKNPEGTPVVMKGSAPMQRGQQLFGPPGYEGEQLQPTQPSADQQSWRMQKKAECGRGFNMPLMLIDLDSSKHNYSSARFDNQPYWRAVAMVQEWLARIALDRIEYEVMREAKLAGEFEGIQEPDEVEIEWGWIKPPQVDPTKESQADRLNLQNQTVSWSEAVIGQGKDPDHVLESLRRDKERLEKAGLPIIPGIPDPSKAAGGGAGGQVAGTKGNKEKAPAAGAPAQKDGEKSPSDRPESARSAELLALAMVFQEMARAENCHANAG
jgi:capsid protein